MARFGLLLSLVCALLLHAKEAPNDCAGMADSIQVLGSEVSVPKVEWINEERAKQLYPYSQGATVRSQLKVEGRFGFVSVKNESLAGFVVAEREKSYINIVSIGVDPKSERQANGRDLVAHVVEHGRSSPGVEDVRVILTASDEDSIAFFTRIGFKISERLPHHFDSGKTEGVLLKISLKREDTESAPRLQAVAQPQKPKVSIATETIPATEEFLHRIDPTLRNAGPE